jgi:hypothetical protein
MPVESKLLEVIKCDNPNCPGHPNLDANDRKGWLFIQAEVYGNPVSQHVYGNVECLNAHTDEKSASNFLAATAPRMPLG